MWKLIDGTEGDTIYEAPTKEQVIQYAVMNYVKPIGSRHIYRVIGDGDRFQIDVGCATLLTVEKV